MSVADFLFFIEKWAWYSVSQRSHPSKAESNWLFVKLGSIPRYTEKRLSFKTKEGKYKFSIPDVESFLSMYSSIFADECYKFSSDSDGRFTILDFGANIGMSVLYFYETYPNANIYGFEADPKIYKYLESNVAGFSQGDERLHIYNKAVWTEETELFFSPDGSDGGRVSDKATAQTRVQAVDVRKIMEEHEHIDFLKIDIEGSERAVIPSLKDYLQKVDKLFLEYHSEADKPQCLTEIMKILHDAGYRVYISDAYRKNKPYIGFDMFAGYDNLLEIFAVR